MRSFDFADDLCILSERFEDLVMKLKCNSIMEGTGLVMDGAGADVADVKSRGRGGGELLYICIMCDMKSEQFIKRCLRYIL